MRTTANKPVVFRFRRPSGSVKRKPSVALVRALLQLSESHEMQPLLAEAQESGREVVIEVFHAKSGQQLLIHTTLLPRESA